MSEESTNKETARRISSNNEPSTSKNAKRTSLEANHFLKNKHPELFEISPIPGGFRRHSHIHRNSYQRAADSETSEAQIEPPSTTKSRRKDRPNIGEVFETTIRCPSARRPVSKDDVKNNTVRMCSIAISTVMMLAQRTYDDITTEHVRHTQEYFRGLRQPDGYPENIGQLMQLLNNLKESGKIVSSVNNEEHYEEKNKEEQDHETQMRD